MWRVISTPFYKCMIPHTLRTRPRMRTALARALNARVRAYASNSLAHEIRGPPLDEKPLDNVIFWLHGLMGQGKNWRTFTSRLRQSLVDRDGRSWRIVLVDLRGHGASASVGAGTTSEELLVDAARDVEALVNKLGVVPKIVVGHSLGGKIALEYSKIATAVPTQIWSLDSSPGKVEVSDAHGAGRVLAAIRQLPSRIPSRRWLAEALPKEFSRGLVDWIGSNLKNVSGGEELEWVHNFETVEALYQSFRNTDSWPAFEDPRTDFYVVKAERSTAWSATDVARLQKTPRSKFMVLPRADHWLHTDNPDGLLELMSDSILADL